MILIIIILWLSLVLLKFLKKEKTAVNDPYAPTIVVPNLSDVCKVPDNLNVVSYTATLKVYNGADIFKDLLDFIHL